MTRARRRTLALAGSILAAGTAIALLPPTAGAAPSAPSPRGATAKVAGCTVTLTPRRVNPLTGLPSQTTGPVVAVKISNTMTNAAKSRPQSGLNNTDQVWVQEVEAGRTRFIGVYGSQYPTKVGPVRSGRETDLRLLPVFGRPAIAYAGGNPSVQALFERQARARTIVDLGKSARVRGVPVRKAVPSTQRFSSANTYYFDARRPNTANFYVNVCRLRPFAALGGATPPRPMGFVFGRAIPGGRSATTATVRWSAASTGTWRYSRGTYAVAWDGVPLRDRESGRPLTATNVVVLQTPVRASRLTDEPPFIVPVSDTIGRGRAWVLREGRVWQGSWSRASLTSPLLLRNTAGRTITLAPGRTWVALQPNGPPYSRLRGDYRTISVR